MAQKKRTGSAAKVYDCFGERLTVKEAAERVCVSEGTLRYRLQKCGDDMEAAMSYYTNERPSARDTDEMVAALVNSIMGDGANPDDELPEGAISGGDEPMELSEAWAERHVADEMPGPKESVQQTHPELQLLHRYNHAIASLTDLAASDMLDASVVEIVCVCIGRLRQARSGRFDCYVDWNAVASYMSPLPAAD